MPGKLYIKTFGCQMNEYDSGKIAQVLAQSHGLDLADSPEQADVLLLNTCAIREKAQEKVFSQLGVWKEWKKANPSLVIGVGGCVASQEGEAIRERAPYVDMVFGPQTLHRLPAMLDSVLRPCSGLRPRSGQRAHAPVVDVSFPEIEKFDCLPPPKAEGPTAFVSIMEGCGKYCTYCVVPFTRGAEVSRPFDDVLVEVAQLVEQGVREVTLLGQNVNAYRGVMHDGVIADLAVLLHYLQAIDGLGRIRYTTSHPVELSDELIDAFRNVPKLAGHLHLPVQSGADRILAAMKRGHTILQYKEKIKKLRQARPELSISTDFIVGFPGETEEDFQATLQLIEEIGFDHSFSFLFSPRPGTPAANLPDTLPLALKKNRLAQVQAALQAHADRIAHAMIGTMQTILVERPARKDPNQLAGRTENNCVVNFSGPMDLIGQFVSVRITEALPNSLRGELP